MPRFQVNDTEKAPSERYKRHRIGLEGGWNLYRLFPGASIDTQDKCDAAWKKIEAALNAFDKAYQASSDAVFLGGDMLIYVNYLDSECLCNVEG